MSDISVSEVNPLALLELTVEGSEEEKDIDSDVEFIDEVIPNEKEIGRRVETEEAVANIVDADSGNNGHVTKDLQLQVEQVFSYPQIPTFDLTEENQLTQIFKEINKKKAIKTTPDERMFRRNFFKENPHIGKFRVHCTVCDVHLGTAAAYGSRVKLHQSLGVLVCSKCYKPRTVDNYKELTTCNWCYTRIDRHGYNYIRCTKCCAIFCQVCVERNLGPDVCKDLDQSPNWECFMCEPRQIWPHRVIAVGLAKHHYRVKINQQKYPEEYLKDRAECCQEKQQNSEGSTSQVSCPTSQAAGSTSQVSCPTSQAAGSTSQVSCPTSQAAGSTSQVSCPTSQAAGSAYQVAGSTSQTAGSAVGIAIPRYKSPPPLLPMPPQPASLSMPQQPTVLSIPPQPPVLSIPPQPHHVPYPHNIQTFTIIDQNKEKRQVFVPCGNTNVGHVQFAPQSQTPIFLQSNDGTTIQVDPEVMKQVFLQGNQTVTLNTGPQVIHNVYHNKRLVMLNQDPKTKTVSILKTTPQHFKVQNININNNDEMNQVQIPHWGNNSTVSPQTMEQENQIKIVHSGTLIDTKKLTGPHGKTRNFVGTTNSFGVTNPISLSNRLPVHNKSSMSSSVTCETPPTGSKNLTPTILRNFSKIRSNVTSDNVHHEYQGKTSNKSENINMASSHSRPSIEHHSITKSNNVSTIKEHELAKNSQEIPNLPRTLQHDPTQKVIAVANSERINTYATAKKPTRRTSLLQYILTGDRDPDPLAIADDDDDDDVMFVENDPDECEINDPIINFVDVQSVVKEITIQKILETGDSNMNQCKEKEKVVDEPRPKIKIKAIEELIDVNNSTVETSKSNNVSTIIEHELAKNSRDKISEVKNLEEPVVNLRSLKIGMDGVQRVLISLIKSIRSKRSTLKSYKEYTCESSVAAKLISNTQKELKMCTRQLNVIQSNIYEYYKDVANVLEPSDIDDIKVNQAETDLPVLPKSNSVNNNENTIICIDDVDVTTENDSDKKAKKSTNYHENFTKFLSSYNNKPVNKKSLSKSKQTESNFQNDFDNSVGNGTVSLKRKRPKLNFDLSNKRNISGSPIVTEDDLKNKNSRRSSFSYETSKKSVNNRVSSRRNSAGVSKKLLTEYNIKQCSVLLHRLDPQLIRLHQSL